MKKMNVFIRPPSISYPILIGKEIIAKEILLQNSSHANSYAIFCDKILEETIGKRILNQLSFIGKKTAFFSLSGGEEIKTRQFKETLENGLIKKGFGRDSCLIAIGGGSLLDLVGFIAATYCRGIPYISIPTTLLAMTDASIGGKTGINVGLAKNFIGATHQPAAVILDIATLKDLPEKEIACGLMESIKHGLIASEPLFSFIEKSLSLILGRDDEILLQLIDESVLIKKSIVEKDEKEFGLRRLVNFGHTVGHALEVVFNYSIKHGDAVAFGMLVEAYFSHHMGYLSYLTFARICELIERIFKPFPLPEEVDFELFYKRMCLDKKTFDGIPRFVMLEEIGKPMSFNESYVSPIPLELLKKGFKWMKNQGAEAHALHCH